MPSVMLKCKRSWLLGVRDLPIHHMIWYCQYAWNWKRRWCHSTWLAWRSSCVPPHISCPTYLFWDCALECWFIQVILAYNAFSVWSFNCDFSNSIGVFFHLNQLVLLVNLVRLAFGMAIQFDYVRGSWIGCSCRVPARLIGKGGAVVPTRDVTKLRQANTVPSLTKLGARNSIQTLLSFCPSLISYSKSRYSSSTSLRYNIFRGTWAQAWFLKTLWIWLYDVISRIPMFLCSVL